MKKISALVIAKLLIFNNLLIGQSSYPVSYSVPQKLETSAGATFSIPVTFKVDDSWYIYAPTGNNATQGMIETTIIYRLPQGISRKGKMQLPETHYKSGFEVYDGKNIQMIQPFTVGKDLEPGEYIIHTKISYQTCNEKICLPPKTDELDIKVIVKDASISGSTAANVDSSLRTPDSQQFAADQRKAAKPLDLKFTALDGRKVDIAKLKGKLVLVDCWATWCRPCIAEFDNLKKMYDKYHSKGFEVIGISMDDATAKMRVKELITKNKLPWPQGFEGKGFDNNSFVKTQQIASLPTVFLIDKEGNIVDRDARGEQLEDLIKKYL